MSKKKRNRSGIPKGASASKAPAPAPKKNLNGLFIAGAIVLIVVGIVAVSRTGGGALQPDPDEARYIGRLLPAAYESPVIAEPTAYTAKIGMTRLVATPSDTQVSVPVADVAAAKNVLFEYALPSGETLPLIAYVRPSGKLFVGISFCPPCNGEGQTIDTDGTLTCDACGTKRDLETEVGISGSCRLYPLDEIPVTIVDGEIVIERSVLDEWSPQPLDRKVG